MRQEIVNGDIFEPDQCTGALDAFEKVERTERKAIRHAHWFDAAVAGPCVRHHHSLPLNGVARLSVPVRPGVRTLPF